MPYRPPPRIALRKNSTAPWERAFPQKLLDEIIEVAGPGGVQELVMVAVVEKLRNLKLAERQGADPWPKRPGVRGRDGGAKRFRRSAFYDARYDEIVDARMMRNVEVDYDIPCPDCGLILVDHYCWTCGEVGTRVRAS